MFLLSSVAWATMKFLSIFILLSLTAFPLAAAEKTLDIYFIDVEGGQATLIVTPDKQSLLVDTGWPGFEDRDADRIVKAAKMIMSPCARFTSRMMPKTRLRPTAARAMTMPKMMPSTVS